MAEQDDTGKPGVAPTRGDGIVDFVGATLIDGSGAKPLANARRPMRRSIWRADGSCRA